MIKKPLKKLIHWAMRHDDEDEDEGKIRLTAVPSKDELPNHRMGMSFHLYPAHGGTVIEVRNRNHKTDELHTTLHVVPDGEDFTQTLSQVVSIERLKS